MQRNYNPSSRVHDVRFCCQLIARSSDFWYLNRVIHFWNCLAPGLNDVMTVKDFKLFLDSVNPGFLLPNRVYP